MMLSRWSGRQSLERCPQSDWRSTDCEGFLGLKLTRQMRVHLILLLGYRIRLLDFELVENSKLARFRSCGKRLTWTAGWGQMLQLQRFDGLKLVDVRITGFTYPMAYHFCSNLFFYYDSVIQLNCPRLLIRANKFCMTRCIFQGVADLLIYEALNCKLMELGTADYLNS